jgi:hypothetical protein
MNETHLLKLIKTPQEQLNIVADQEALLAPRTKMNSETYLVPTGETSGDETQDKTSPEKILRRINEDSPTPNPTDAHDLPNLTDAHDLPNEGPLDPEQESQYPPTNDSTQQEEPAPLVQMTPITQANTQLSPSRKPEPMAAGTTPPTPDTKRIRIFRGNSSRKKNKTKYIPTDDHTEAAESSTVKRTKLSPSENSALTTPEDTFATEPALAPPLHEELTTDAEQSDQQDSPARETGTSTPTAQEPIINTESAPDPPLHEEPTADSEPSKQHDCPASETATPNTLEPSTHTLESERGFESHRPRPDNWRGMSPSQKSKWRKRYYY